MDVNAFIEQYKEEQHQASEYKEDISFQLKMKDNLEATLPSNIVIGPFYINTEPLKLFLVNKRQEIANKMLDQFCAIMKNNIEDVIQEFKFLMVRLADKPTSIEHIYEIRDWMETIPMSVRTQEELTRRYLLEYDVLEYFWYALPQEDFENKWEAIGWPYKISQQIETTNTFLDDEWDKYYKIQMNDELTLEEKVEHLTVLVTQMSGLRDFSKTHEIAVDIRRVWKAMKEAQEQGQLLNSRQKLFLAPITPYETLNKLIKEFEPYRNLWITASGILLLLLL
ncbi:hypothetical protein ILUMI_10928 [Ignelater luminosus]|uniref:Uncharacterized protein n=1 Tax=Ignelater luminosus TaxID=2038154 RepID=A0A8K0D2D1_IGNLU|nr:hypothetical protein ILUMI_10928 [Ignelater luminosus]